MPTPKSLQGLVHVEVGVFQGYRLFLIGLGFALALLMWLFLERSRLGAMVRAGVDDASMAGGLGANVPALFTAIFGAGVALAALGGVAAGPILGLYPGMDTEILIPAFIVIVIGGMGSLRGAFVGSLLIGIADTFGKAYLPSMALFLIYLVMAVVLLVRPQGLFGIAHSPASSAPTFTLTAMPSRHARTIGIVTLAAMIVFPFLVPSYPRELVAEIYIFAIFAMSLDLILGFTGLMSLGHAAFFGLGAYGVAILGAHYGVNAWIGVGAGVFLATAGAALIGFFCVRTTGIPFLMLTLAFSQLIYSIALKWRELTGGTDGLAVRAENPRPEIGFCEERVAGVADRRTEITRAKRNVQDMLWLRAFSGSSSHARRAGDRLVMASLLGERLAKHPIAVDAIGMSARASRKLRSASSQSQSKRKWTPPAAWCASGTRLPSPSARAAATRAGSDTSAGRASLLIRLDE